MRINGVMQELNLWSKLATKQWPLWPDWQDTLRMRMPVFRLHVRPATVLCDGSCTHIAGLHVVVYNHDGETIVTQADRKSVV